ncbi:MAG: hypothetical protein DRP90_02765 [Planctomycetota bacterium]|nr:MAG: hypothetical protein DRP90_02765 [Planctomycetota bacterium]
MKKYGVAAALLIAAVVVWKLAILSPRRTAPSETVLTFWHIQNYSPTREVIDAAVKRFLASHSGVEVKVTAMRNDDYKTKLELAFRAGDPPDVFHTWGGGMLADKARAGLLLPLDPLFARPGFRDRILPAALPFCFSDGKSWCVPADLSVVLFFYDRETFAKAGVEPPATFDELLAACRRLREKGVEPIALGNMDRWPGCFYYVYGVVRNGGREAVRKAAALEKGAFLSPAFVKAGEMIRGMVKAGCFNRGFQGMKTDASRRLLFTGKAAMTLMGTWFIAHAATESPAGLERYGCFPFPALGAPGGDDSAVVGGLNCAYALSASCKHPDLAMDLLDCLTDARFASDWAATGRIPAVKGAPPSSFNPLTRRAFEILSRASFIQMYFDQLFGPRLAEVHKDTCQALFSLSMDPRAVAEKLEETASKLR